MKKLFLIGAACLAATSSICHAGIGETYKQSCRHYGNRGVRQGDHVMWLTRDGYNVTEGYDSDGRCAIIVFSRADVRYPITPAQARRALRDVLPPGGTWHYYGDNVNGDPCWATVVNGIKWYAIYYVDRAYSEATGPTWKTCIRIGTEEQLAGRGYLTHPVDNDESSDLAAAPVTFKHLKGVDAAVPELREHPLV